MENLLFVSFDQLKDWFVTAKTIEMIVGLFFLVILLIGFVLYFAYMFFDDWRRRR